MTEKLKLEWNDFQSNVSQSFGVFRHEDYLQDVTLVTDDKIQMSAHKLILSASSDYFKSLFQTNAKHTHPLVCLNDVDGKVLGYILDYMYHGQVQIFEESLDSFIKVAQRFKLEGINVAKETGIGCSTVKSDPEEKFHHTIIEKDSGKPLNETSKEKENGEARPKVEDISTNQYDLNVRKYMKKTNDGKVECTFCGKIEYPPSQLKRHIETHFSGMKIACPLCHTVLKTKESLRVHMYRHKV